MIKLEELLNEIEFRVPYKRKGSLTHGAFPEENPRFRYDITLSFEQELRIVGLNLGGNVWNVAFTRITDDPSDVKSYARNKGEENMIRVYSTMIDITKEFCRTNKPEFVSITSLKDAKYKSIYEKLANLGKVPNYSKVKEFTYFVDGEEMEGMLFKRD